MDPNDGALRIPALDSCGCVGDPGGSIGWILEDSVGSRLWILIDSGGSRQ